MAELNNFPKLLNALEWANHPFPLADTEVNSTTNKSEATLKGYWRGEETSGVTAADSSNNSHPGTASRANILSQAAKFGNGFTFVSASNDKITITDHADFKPTGSFSIGAWIKTSTTGVYQIIFQSYNETPAVYGIELRISNTNVAQLVINGNGLLGTRNICDGNWHYVVGTWNGTTAHIYVDGMINASGSLANASYNATNYVRIGNRTVAGTDSLFFNGQIDDVFFFNNKALTQYEVQLCFSPYTRTKGYWKFEETSGTSIADSSGNSHPGTASRSNILGQAGKFGNGGTLVSASSDKVSIPDHVDLKPTGPFTIGAWFKSSTNASQVIFSSYSQNPNSAGIQCYLASNVANFFIGKNTGMTSGTDYMNLGSSKNVCDGNWHQVVCTWDGREMWMYIDGVVESAIAWTGVPGYHATNYVRIGCNSNTGPEGSFFNGQIDDVFLLNGSALSYEQVSQLYGAIAYYRMESGVITTDAKGVNNLTNVNGVQSVVGKYGNGADSGNSNTNKYLYKASQLGILNGSDFTISLWVKLNVEITSGTWNFAHFMMARNIPGITYDYNGGTRRVWMGGWNGDYQNQNITHNIALGTTNWHHLVLVRRSNRWYGYINGVFFGSVAAQDLASNVYTPQFSLFSNNVPGGFASVILDDVAVFSRALVLDEILQLYKDQLSSWFLFL